MGGSRTTHAALTFLLLTVALPPPPSHAAETFGDHTYYFGELHAHTGMSGDGASTDLGNCDDLGCGDFATFFETAQNLAGLDFAAITDHINEQFSMNDADWDAVVALVNDGHDPGGGFLTVLGAELVIHRDDDMAMGHKQYLFFGDQDDYLQIPMDELAAPGTGLDCDGLLRAFWELNDAYGPMLAIPHHPASMLPMPTRWWCHDELISPVAEIYSSHGNSRANPVADPYDPVSQTVEDSTIQSALLPDPGNGLHLGLIGGTDFHDSFPGMTCHLDLIRDDQLYGGSLTGVILDAATPWSRDSLLAALKARHTYATSGPLVPALLSLHDGGGSQLAINGDIIHIPANGPITFRLTLPPDLMPYVHEAMLHTYDGETLELLDVGGGLYELSWALESPPAGWFAYASVTLDGDNWWSDQGIPCDDGGAAGAEKLWTSPIWLEEGTEVDDDGDGYAEAHGDCDDTADTVHPGAEELPNHVDDDCDGEVDEGTEFGDGDQDGYSPADGDCNDEDASVSPGAEEQCDGIEDNNCDGQPDPLELDGDGDDVSPCEGDCDDTDPMTYPYAPEICDGIPDNDCDGLDDPRDTDGDGDGYAPCNDDCDDGDAAIHPGADEADNGIDDNCDGQVDEGIPEPGCECAKAGGDPPHTRLLLIAAAASLWLRRRR